MDTGKILIGFAFIILSVALMTAPSSAEMQGPHSDDNSGYAVPTGQQAALSPDLHGLTAPAGAGLSSMDTTDQAGLP
jgi:hypothetical protein